MLFENVLWYRPRPLQMRMHEWISPVSISLRDLTVAGHTGWPPDGRRRACRADGFQAGFTHMEWYRKADGEVGVRRDRCASPGARVVDLMNYATDGDLYVGWAEAVVHGRMQQLERHYNVGSIFKRAHGCRPDHPRRRTERAARRLR